MAGGEKPNNRKRKLAGIAGSVISLAVLTYIAIGLISGRGAWLSWVKGLFSSREPVEYADEYHFDVGRDRVFAVLGDSLAAVGTLGIQVLDAAGNETLRVPVRMSAPAVCAQGGRAVAFDIGGAAVWLFNETDTVMSFDPAGAVIEASMNRNGWICVCSQDSGGFKGAVDVYNDRNRAVYKVRLESGYVLSAALSPDNKTLAVLNLAEEGSRVSFYDLNSETPGHVFVLPGELIIDMWYLKSGDLLVVSTDSLFITDKNGAEKKLYDYSGSILGGYTFTGDFTALHILDYGVGYNGWIVALDEAGKLLGVIRTEREIMSISAGAGFLAVLRSDGFFFYDFGLGELPPANAPGSATAATRILALDDSSALAAGDNSAVVVRIGS